MLLKLSFDGLPSATYFSMNSFNSKEFLHFLTSLIFNMPSPHFWRASATALSTVLERGLFIFKSLHWSSKSKPFRTQTVNAASQRRTFLASYVRSMPNKAGRAPSSGTGELDERLTSQDDLCVEKRWVVGDCAPLKEEVLLKGIGVQCRPFPRVSSG